MIIARQSYNKDYFPDKETIKFFIWLNTYFDEENKSAESHFQLIDHLFKKYQFKGFECSRGLAKALSLDSKVYLNGYEKTIADVSIGDEIYGSDGKLHKVLAKSKIFNKTMYEITFKDGRKVKCSEDHIWTMFKRYTKRNPRVEYKKDNGSIRGMRVVDITAKDLYEDFKGKQQITKKKTKEDYWKYFVPLTNAVKYEEKDLPIDPYTLGLLIGDGALKNNCRLIAHKDDYEHYIRNIPYNNGVIRKRDNCFYWTVKSIRPTIKSIGLNVTSEHKFIPNLYLYSSIEQRLAILRGLMDTDGTTSGCYQSFYTTTSKQLADDVLTLVYSLGGEGHIRESESFCNGKKCKNSFRVSFVIPYNPFSIERKAKKVKFIDRRYMAVVDVKIIEDEPSQCIMVDADDKLFLTDNYILTHNSTLIGIYHLLYIAFLGRKPYFGKVDYVLYIMDTVSQVAANFEQMIMILEDNPELKKHLEIKKSRLGDDPTLYIYNKDLNRTIYFKGRGAGQKMRGTRIGGKRPNIILLDDIENDENVESKENREKLANWFFNAVIPAVNPNNFEIDFIGTPIHQDALLLNLLEGAGDDEFFKQYEFKFIQLPAAEHLTESMIKGQSDEEIISAWSDRFTLKYLRTMYGLYASQGKTTAFWQEFMLQIAPKENLLFDISKIRKYKQADMAKNRNNMTFYITVDLAISQKDTADYTVISIIGINDNNDWMLIDGFFGRIKPDETMEKIFEYVVMYRPYEVVIEKVAFQTAMKTFLEREMLLRNIYFSINMVSRPQHKNSKLTVLKGLQPIVNMGKFWVAEDYMENFIAELFNEMQMITNEKILAKHDDLIDSIAQLTLIRVLVQNPVGDVVQNNHRVTQSKNSYLF